MKIEELKKDIEETKETLQWILTNLQQHKGSSWDDDKQLLDDTISRLETMENDKDWEAEINASDFNWEKWKGFLEAQLIKIIQSNLPYHFNTSKFLSFMNGLDAIVWENGRRLIV